VSTLRAALRGVRWALGALIIAGLVAEVVLWLWWNHPPG
jgi:hypothetical protein